MFLLKIVREDKNIIKNAKTQPAKTICETVNFGSTKLTKQKKKKNYRNITEWCNIFIIPLYIILLYFILTGKELTLQQL